MNIRESIFRSSFRVFFSSLAAVLGIFIAIFLSILGLGMIPDSVTTADPAKLTVSADASGDRKLLPDTTPVILRIDFHGVIGDGDLSYSKIEKMLLDSREGPLKKDRVKAILLHVNTPGGFVTDADAIYRSLKSYKQKYQVPIYAFVEGMCASGGMFICAAADKIYATADSTIGSIGVILGPTFNFSEAMQKLGIQSLTLTEGKNKDMLNPFRPWKEGEDRSLKNVLSHLYNQFVEVVVQARSRVNRNLLINQYGAQIFIAEEAEKIGFIDHANSSYTQTLSDLAKEATIEEKYQVLHIEPSRSILSEVTKGKFPLSTNKIKHIFPLGTHITSEHSGKFLYLYENSVCP